MPGIRAVLTFAIVFVLLYPLGLLTHEVVGHGLPGLMFGSRPTALHILGLDLYPHICWRGWQGTYGFVDGTPVQPEWRMHLVRLGGSLSTALAAAVALYLLWKKPRAGWRKLALVSVSLWWLDLFTYTLPVWGIRRSILWGRMYAEPYEAAIALGVPGIVFQIAVLAAAVGFTAALVRILRRDSRASAAGTEPGADIRFPDQRTD